MKNEKKHLSKGVTTVFLIIGIVLLALAVVFLVLYLRSWSSLNSSMSSGSTHSSGSACMTYFTLMGVCLFLGLPSISIGLSPYITKIRAKIHSENVDYAGKDIAVAGQKTADVLNPVVANTAKEISKAVGTNGASQVATEVCPTCHEVVKSGRAFCVNCGQVLRKKCAKCGHINDVTNKCCGECGNKL